MRVHVHYHDCGDSFVGVHMYVRIDQSVHFKSVWLIECQLYLNKVVKNKMGKDLNKLHQRKHDWPIST